MGGGSKRIRPVLIRIAADMNPFVVPPPPRGYRSHSGSYRRSTQLLKSALACAVTLGAVALAFTALAQSDTSMSSGCMQMKMPLQVEMMRQHEAMAMMKKAQYAKCWRQCGLHERLQVARALVASRVKVMTLRSGSDAGAARILRRRRAGRAMARWGEVAMAALDAASFACLASLARGEALDTAHHAACALDRAFNLPACIQSFVGQGLISALVSCDEHPGRGSCQ